MQSKLIILRKENNVTQADIARILCISTKAYSFKENGKTQFSMNEMFLISQYFKLDIEDIFLPTIHQNGV